MSNLELTNTLRELKELKAMQEELQAEIDSLQDKIKAYMTAQAVDTLAVDIFKVSYKEVKSTRFDSTAFKKTHTDLYNLFTKETVSKRFTVN